MTICGQTLAICLLNFLPLLVLNETFLGKMEHVFTETGCPSQQTSAKATKET